MNRQMALLLVLSVATTLAARGDSLPIAFEASDSFSIQGRALRLPQRFVQTAPDRVVMEAEDATAISWEGKAAAGIHYDEGAAGGASICHVEEAKLAFTITNAQSYRVWMRARFNAHGHWNHQERMDGKAVHAGNITDLQSSGRNSPKLHTWIWVEGMAYELAVGQHEYTFTYKGGCELDKVVLLPLTAPAPTALGPPPAKTAAREHTLLSHALVRAPDASWPQLTGRLALRGGSIRLAISSDGAAWTILKGPSELGAATHGQTKLFLRVVYSTTSQQSPIWFDPGIELQLPALTASRTFSSFTRLKAIPLFPRKMTGVTWTGNQFGLAADVYRANTDGAFYFEAEAPQTERLQMDAAAVFAEDPTASGTRYVRNDIEAENQLQFRLELDKASDYTVWVRLRRRHAKHSNTGARMMWDVSEMKTAKLNTSSLKQKASAKITSMSFGLPRTDKKTKPPIVPTGTWLWLKGNSRSLAAGSHTLYLNGGFGYSDLDRIAVLPTGQTPSDDDANSARAPAQVGEVLFSPVFPVAQATPTRVVPAAGWHVSTDGGRDFTPLPPDGALPAHDYATGNLLLKAELNRAHSPVLVAPRVLVDGELDVATIQSPTLALHFDSNNGRMLGLYNRTAERWMTPLGNQGDIFSLSYDVPGEGVLRSVRVAEPRVEALVAGDDQSFVATYRTLGDAITLRIRYAFGADGLCESTITAVNRSAYNLRELGYLRVDELRTTATPINETLGWPNYFGAAFAFPSGGFAASSRIIYPGTASLSFFCLGDVEQTLYVAERQTNGLHHTMSINIPQANETMAFALNKSVCVPPSTDWTGTYRFGLVPGDWHAAADIHRAWLRSWLPPSDQPDWVKDCIGFWNNQVRFFTRLPISGAMLNDWYGLHYNQVWGWTGEGEYIGSYPIPDPRLGSQAQAKVSFAKFTGQGNHVGYYMNAQEYCDDFRTADPIGWSVPRKDLPAEYLERVEGKEFFDRNIQRTLSGEKRYQPVNMGTRENAYQMCASSSEWPGHFTRWISDVWVKDYGVNALYFDQAGCVIQRCFSPEHGHGLQHATSGNGFREVIRQTLSAGRRHDPDFVVGIEGILDSTAAYTAYGLWVGSSKLQGNFFKYVLPEINLARGISNGHIARYQTRDEALRDICLYNWIDYFSPSAQPIIEVRQQTRPFVNRGRFMDTVGLRLQAIQGEAYWYLRSEGGWQTAAVTVHNVDGQAGGRVVLTGLPFPGPFRAFTFAESEEPQAINAETVDDAVQLSVPAAKFSVLVLVKAVPAKDRLLLLAKRPLQKGPDVISATVINLAAAPQQATVQFADLPDGVVVTPAIGRATVAPGAVRALTFAVNGMNSLNRWEKSRVQATSGDAVAATTVLLAPPIVNGSMEDDRNGDNFVDAWAYFAGQWDRFIRANQQLDIQGINGEIDTAHPADGINCLLLAGPIDAYDLDRRNCRRYPPIKKKRPRNRVVRTPLVLKPDTAYRLTAQFRAASAKPKQASISILPGNYLSGTVPTAPNQWTESTFEFSTKPGDTTLKFLSIVNTGGERVWVDAVRLVEVAR